MGAPPELPDPSENDLRPIETAHVVPFSDESDNELMDHDGYEPLALDDDFNDVQDHHDEEERINEYISAQEAVVESAPDINLPTIERAEVEIEREVWSAPRPQETNIVLDDQRTAQILNAMANFSLPNMTLPEWADPEERWKEELLQRIRQRKEQQEDSKCEQKT